MKKKTRAEQLAHAWIQGWIDDCPDDIPLADDFVHTSPFGELTGRDHYLDTIKPASKRNVTKLTIRQTLGNDKEAVIRFDMETPKGTIPCVDWISIEGNRITRIHSFYDASLLRGSVPEPARQ